MPLAQHKGSSAAGYLCSCDQRQACGLRTQRHAIGGKCNNGGLPVCPACGYEICQSAIGSFPAFTCWQSCQGNTAGSAPLPSIGKWIRWASGTTDWIYGASALPTQTAQVPTTQITHSKPVKQ